MVYDKTDGDTWTGTETFTMDFGDGDAIAWTCHYVTSNVTNPLGVSSLLETCTIGSGTGVFQNASGIITTRGSFGPGFSLFGQTLDGQTWYAAAETDGVITGLDVNTFVAKMSAKSLRARRFPMVRRR
jgi:hypothetical protein